MEKKINKTVIITAIFIILPLVILIVNDYYPAIPSNPNFKHGITYVPFSTDILEDEKEYDNIDEMIAMGVDWVSVVPYWHQDTYKSTIIHPNFEESASDKGVIKLIQYLHSKNIKIMLKPHVDSIDKTWRAEFKPISWAKWFDSYRNFICHYAEMAEDEEIELFCVGCEYSSSDSTQYDEWKETIKEIKKHYTGDLVYASDYPQYDEVCFWDLIDYIGIDGYFPLYDGNNPKLSDLIVSWENTLNDIEKWRKNSDYTDKQIIITEVGYESQPKCWESPGYTGSNDLDLNAQDMCYKALFSTMPKREWIEGMFIWWWDNPTTHDQGGGIENNGWTPKGKPAGTTIWMYYHFHGNPSAIIILLIIMGLSVATVIKLLIVKKHLKNLLIISNLKIQIRFL